MHVSIPPVRVTVFLLCVTIVTTNSTGIVYQMDPPRKCCVVGYAFNENLECVHVESDRLNYTHDDDTWQSIAPRQSQRITTVIAIVQGLSCQDDAGTDRRLLRTYTTVHVPRGYCIENTMNGTAVLAKCPDTFTESTRSDERNGTGGMLTRTTTTIITTVTIITTTITTTTTTTTVSNGSTEYNNGTDHHGNGLGTVVFWGAQTYMNTNVAHVVLCFIVVVTYLSVPELGKSIYNRAILRHNACLLALGCILTFLGYCDLCDCGMTMNFTVFLWILLQYFTNATAFWLNVICFDMTLSITRFRWMVGSGQRTNRGENRRLLLYGIFAWGGALIPAVAALIFEYCPGIPMDFPLKPNYQRYSMGPNVVVNIYFFGIPLLPLFWNNVLFVYATYKIIRIQRSTEIATRNQTNRLRKKYFLFLQMYLLMGAPWFFGSLFACLNKLVTLKMCRLIQPILWLLMLATNRKLRQRVASKLCVAWKKRDTAATANP